MPGIAQTTASTKPSAGTAYDLLSTLTGSIIAVTGAVTATISRMHYCTGTSASYTVTLPAASGNTGKLIGFQMGPSASLSKLVTLDGNASETIDGALTRVMWALEAAILLCDGSNWFKIAGKSIPMQSTIRLKNNTPGATQTITTTTVTKVLFDQSDLDNTGLMSDTTNHRINIVRPGSYLASGGGLWNNFNNTYTGGTQRLFSQFYVTGSATVYTTEIGVIGSGGYPSPPVVGTLALALNDYVELDVFQSSGGNNSLYGANSGSSSLLNVTEILTW